MRFPHFDSFFPRSSSGTSGNHNTRERLTTPNSAARNLPLSSLSHHDAKPANTSSSSRYRRSFRERFRGNDSNVSVNKNVHNESTGLRFGRSKYSYSKRNSISKGGVTPPPATASAHEEDRIGAINNLKELVIKSDLFAKHDDDVQRVQKFGNVASSRPTSYRQRIKSANPVSPRNHVLDDERGSLKDLKEMMRNSDLMTADDTVEPVLKGSRFVRSKNVQPKYDIPGRTENAATSVVSTAPITRNLKLNQNDTKEEVLATANDFDATKNMENIKKDTQELPVQGSRFIRAKSNDNVNSEAIQEPHVRGSRFIRTEKTQIGNGDTQIRSLRFNRSRNVLPISKPPRDEYEEDDVEDDRRSLNSLKEYMKKTDLVGGDAGQREWSKGSRFEKKSDSDPLPARPLLKGDRARTKRSSSLLVRDEIRRERKKSIDEMDDDDDRGSLRSLKVFMASCDLLSDDGRPSANNQSVAGSSGTPKRNSLRRNSSGRRIRSTIVNDESQTVRRRLNFNDDDQVDDDEHTRSLRSLKEFLDRSELMHEQPRTKRKTTGSRLIRDTRGKVPPAVERRMKRDKKLSVVPEEKQDSMKKQQQQQQVDDEDDRASLSSLKKFMATEGGILLNDEMTNTKTPKSVKNEALIGSPMSDGETERKDGEMKNADEGKVERRSSDKGEFRRKTSASRPVGYADDRRPMVVNSNTPIRRSRLPASPRSEVSGISGRTTSSTFNRFSRIDSSPLSDGGKSISGDNASSSDGTDEKRSSRKSSPRSVLLRGNSASIKAVGADLLKAINKDQSERDYSGKYCNFFPMIGCFRCRACSRPLYSADAKFDARTGYSSFDRCYRGAVETSVGSRRSSLRCAACKVHLGHIVDGEWLSYTNERHSIVSAAISYDSNPCGKLETTLRSGVTV